MSDTQGIKVWTSNAMPSDRALTIGDLTAFRDAVLTGGKMSPSVAVMSPRIYDQYRDILHTEAVRKFLKMVGPFHPVTFRGVWYDLTSAWQTVTHRLAKAARVLRYGYDPEDTY